MRTLLLSLALCLSANAETRWARVWKASLVVLAAANVADCASSWGHAEMNPLLGQRFGYRGVGVKAGIFSGIAVAEYLLHRRGGDDKVMALSNLSGAGLLTGVAISNVRRQP